MPMDFSLSSRLAGRFDFTESTGSTNFDLVNQAIENPSEFPHFSVLVAAGQSSGRGRVGRVWVSPNGKSLAMSVLVRSPNWPEQSFSWLPLVAGLAMRRAVQKALPEKQVTLKWPNDVQVAGKKISGILSELLPNFAGVVIGAGINLTVQQAELPNDQSTSLALEGWNLTPDQFLADYLANLNELLNDSDSVPEQVSRECSTIGLQVKAIFPDESEVLGLASGLDSSGRLLISTADSPQLLAVSAADIHHLRHN